MKPTDKTEFVKIVTGMAELYGREISAAAYEVYWNAMQDWPIEQFRRAADHLCKTSQFFPKPADFNALRKPLVRVSPGEAWTKVLDHCRFGTYRDGSGIDDGGPIDRAVAALGGYRAVAMHDASWLHTVERRFAEHLGTAEDAQTAAGTLGHDGQGRLERLQ